MKTAYFIPFVIKKSLQLAVKKAIIVRNNTPPATHKNSALRGVSCLWGG